MHRLVLIALLFAGCSAAPVNLDDPPRSPSPCSLRTCSDGKPCECFAADGAPRRRDNVTRCEADAAEEFHWKVGPRDFDLHAIGACCYRMLDTPPSVRNSCPTWLPMCGTDPEIMGGPK